MPLRRPADPFEAVLRSAGPASRRAERLTRGRMRPSEALAVRAREERRRQVERFLGAVSASPAAGGIRTTPYGSFPVEVHESPLGFWLVDAHGALLPDPAGRTGLTPSGLAALISAGDVTLDPSDPRAKALLSRISAA